MHISATRFVTVFVIAVFVFQFVSNSILGDEVSLFPASGNWYPGTHSPIAWKHNLAAIIYPLKFVLIEPLSFLSQDPDAPPPITLMAFGIYWALMAVVIYYLFKLIMPRKKPIQSSGKMNDNE